MSEVRNELGGSKKLKLTDAVAQSVGFMGPVFSSAFLIPLLVGVNVSGNGAGGAAPLAVLLATVGLLGLGWIVSEYAKRIHAAGSLYDYVTDGLGKKIGAAAGIAYYVGILALGGGILVLIDGTIHDTLASEFNFTAIPYFAWDIALLALAGGLLFAGVSISTRTQLILAGFSLLVVTIFFINVIIQVGSHNSLKAFSPSTSPNGFKGILFGVLYGVLLFTGFETSANLAEETEHPTRDIPRAVLTALIIAAVFYVLAAYAQVAGFGFSIKAISAAAAGPLFALGSPAHSGGYGSVAIRRLLELVVIFDMLAVYVGVSVSASRGLFAMARDRWLPSSLATTNEGRGTPKGASILILGLYFVVILITQLWNGLFALPQTPHYAAIFSWLSTFGPFALSIVYFLMAVGAIKGLSDHTKRWAVYIASTVGGITIAAAIFGSIYKVSAPTIYASYSGLGVFIIALIYTATKKSSQTASPSVANQVTN